MAAASHFPFAVRARAASVPPAVELPAVWRRPAGGGQVQPLDPCQQFASIQTEAAGCAFVLLEDGGRLELET